jgi:hypothetical protein
VAAGSRSHSRSLVCEVEAAGTHEVALAEAVDSCPGGEEVGMNRRPVEDPGHVSTWLSLKGTRQSTDRVVVRRLGVSTVMLSRPLPWRRILRMRRRPTRILCRRRWILALPRSVAGWRRTRVLAVVFSSGWALARRLLWLSVILALAMILLRRIILSVVPVLRHVGGDLLVYYRGYAGP